MLDIAYVVDL